MPDIDIADIKEARKYFPSFGVKLAASRLGGQSFKNVIKRMETEPLKREIVCECENVTMAEIEEMAKNANTASDYTLSDIRRKTRMGMGTCQGAFCTFRSMGMLAQNNLVKNHDTIAEMKDFLQARYKGISPVMWGNTIREVELMRGIYDGVLNIDGGIIDESM